MIHWFRYYDLIDHDGIILIRLQRFEVTRQLERVRYGAQYPTNFPYPVETGENP